MKTYQGWKNGPEMPITDYLQPGDEVDGEMHHHLATVTSPHYSMGSLLQVGEPEFKHLGRYHYMTFGGFGEKPPRYLYLGILPPFKQPK